jgi:lipopolysaccharide exporter
VQPLLKFVKKNSFVKNVSILMSGTAISQGLTISAAPILSRLYEPEAFGIFAIYTSIVTILSVIVTMKYESAIVIAHDKDEAKNIFILSNLIVTFLTFLTFIFILFFGEKLAYVTNNREIANLLWWVPISIFSMGLYQNLLYWNTRNKQFKQAAVSHVSRASIVVSTQITGGMLSKGYSGLVSGQIAGQILSASVLGAQVYKSDKQILKKMPQFKELKRVAYKFKDFPRYSAPQGLFNAVSQTLPTFLLSYFFGVEVLGYYALSLKFIQLPLNFITQSFKQVFFQKISEAINKGSNYLSLLKKMTLALFCIAILPSIVIVIYGTEIYGFVLGEEWTEAGKYAEWIILSLFFGFLNSPAFVTAQALRWQKYLLRYEIALLISRGIALIFGGLFLGAYNTIIIYSLVGCLYNVSLITAIFFYAYKNKMRIS